MTTGMLRTEAVAALARHRGEMLSVVTMQAVEPWNALGQADSRNYNAVGCMGSAAAVGLGLSLARPQDRVLVIDGDGSLLMQLGSLVSIAEQHVRNLYHVVMENGQYETSGGQPVPGRGVTDLCAVALACGYAAAHRFHSPEQCDAQLPTVLQTSGPVLISMLISGPGVVAPSALAVADKPTQIQNMRRALTGSPAV